MPMAGGYPLEGLELAAVTTAVIFDCDGVLVDSEPIAARVLAGLLTEAGLPTTEDECHHLYRGRSMASTIARATELLGHAPPFDVPARYYAEVEAAFAHELEPVDGIADAIARIGLPDCVASSGPHHKMDVSLRTTGLWAHFEGRIFSATEVEHGKPAPDLFLYAASRMGFDAATTVVVEDSVPGVEGGVAAGMRVLGYAAQTDAGELEAAGAEVFDDMALLPALLEG